MPDLDAYVSSYGHFRQMGPLTNKKGKLLLFFHDFLNEFGAKYCEKEAVNQSAASAASLDPILRLLNFLDFCKISSRDQVGC